MNHKYKTWVEVSKKALLHNIRVFQKNIGVGVEIAAVVKANAYGHGLNEIVPLLKNRVEMLAVDNIDEAVAIRKIDANFPVLVL